jgi:hypothetical protein
MAIGIKTTYQGVVYTSVSALAEAMCVDYTVAKHYADNEANGQLMDKDALIRNAWPERCARHDTLDTIHAKQR